MADHQPAMRAHHREVVGDRLCVRRADPDIDDADALGAVAPQQVIRRHLEPLPGRSGNNGRPLYPADRLAPPRPLPGRRAACTGSPSAQLGKRPGHELLDVALIVGEQDPRLHGAPVGAGVVDEAPERVVHARRIEEGERPRLAFAEPPEPVRDLVANGREHRHGEVSGEAAADTPPCDSSLPDMRA